MDQPRTRKATEQLWPGIAGEAEDIAQLAHDAPLDDNGPTLHSQARADYHAYSNSGGNRLFSQEYLCLAASC